LDQTNWMLIGIGIGAAVIIFETVLLIRKKPAKGPGIAQEVPGRDVPSLLSQPELECFNSLHLLVV